MPDRRRLTIAWAASPDAVAVDVDPTEDITVADLKHKLRDVTGVAPDRQRIVRRSGQGQRAILGDEDSVSASDDLALETVLPGGCDLGCGLCGETCNVGCCSVQ